MKYYCRAFNSSEDREIIEGLWKRNLAKVPAKRFDWLYKLSYPATSVFTWLMLKDNKTCGAISIFVRDFKFANRVIRGGIFIDAMVDKAHRTIFPALTLVRSAVEGSNSLGLDFLLAFPNRKAEVIFSKCGFKTISEPIRWSRIINFASKVDHYPGNPLLKKIISRILKIGINSALLLRNFTFFKDVSIVSEYPLGLSKHLCYVEDCLQGISSDPFIVWRYKNNPLRAYKFYSVKCNNGVVSITYFIDGSVAIVESIHFSNPKLISIALHSFAKYLDDRNIGGISLGATSAGILNRQLKKAGFVKRHSSRKLLALELSADCLTNLIDGHILLFDGDMDI